MPRPKTTVEILISRIDDAVMKGGRSGAHAVFREDRLGEQVLIDVNYTDEAAGPFERSGDFMKRA
jgi:hypothetical protein